jgi:hypothetical protein
MRSMALLPAWLLLAAGASPCLAQAQSFSANYELTRPALTATDPDLLPQGRGFALGPVRMAPAFSKDASGAGLSMEAGRSWFGRMTVGRSLDTDQVSVGGGYRWRDGHAVSLQLSWGRSQERLGLSQDRLGLAVRYDWPRYYLRLGYDPRNGGSTQDMLRFSAGVRF